MAGCTIGPDRGGVPVGVGRPREARRCRRTHDRLAAVRPRRRGDDPVRPLGAASTRVAVDARVAVVRRGRCRTRQDYAAWTTSIYDVGAGISTVLINVQVIVLPALALIVDREAISVRFLAATPVLLGGVVLVGGIGSHNAVGDDPVRGTVLGLLAGIGYGSYLYLTRRGSRGQHTLLLQPLLVSTAVAAATTAAVSPATDGISFADISSWSWVDLILLPSSVRWSPGCSSTKGLRRRGRPWSVCFRATATVPSVRETTQLVLP